MKRKPAKNPVGRPPSGRPPTVQITFRADIEVCAALDLLVTKLEQQLGAGSLGNGAKSQAIRRAVLEAAARVPL